MRRKIDIITKNVSIPTTRIEEFGHSFEIADPHLEELPEIEEARYKAYYSDTSEMTSYSLIYKNERTGNLFGHLPLGTMPDINDLGTLNREDGGDPYEKAGFITPSGRHIIVEKE